MFRKALISLAAIAAIGTGVASMTSVANADMMHHHHGDRGDRDFSFGFFPFFGPAYDYGYPYYYQDCGYRRVAVKVWDRAHMHRVIIYRNRWVCY